MIPSPLRLRLDSAALVANWRLLDKLSGPAACGAAVKADGYGLGAEQVVARLAEAGCRDFFVATWTEAAALAPLGVSVSVLHGVGPDEMPTALSGMARPVLNTVQQVARWREGGGGWCDVMVDTGMNRLGLSVQDIADGVVDGLRIDTLMSHLACADQDDAMNARQRDALAGLAGQTTARRLSLANSAGIALGMDYRFDLIRPGLALYGGVPRTELGGVLPVVTLEARVVQRRVVPEGETVGYNATWRAERDTAVAIVNLGYADGYVRRFSGAGAAYFNDVALPVIGSVSMDLTALDVSAVGEIAEGDWVTFTFELLSASKIAGLTQYELLTGLGHRFERSWTRSTSQAL